MIDCTRSFPSARGLNCVSTRYFAHDMVFKSYRTGHVLAATWRMPPPGSQHPGPSSTLSSSNKLTSSSLIDRNQRNQVDCGV
jgi:hypothetical protein